MSGAKKNTGGGGEFWSEKRFLVVIFHIPEPKNLFVLVLSSLIGWGVIGQLTNGSDVQEPVPAIRPPEEGVPYNVTQRNVRGNVNVADQVVLAWYLSLDRIVTAPGFHVYRRQSASHSVRVNALCSPTTTYVDNRTIIDVWCRFFVPSTRNGSKYRIGMLGDVGERYSHWLTVIFLPESGVHNGTCTTTYDLRLILLTFISVWIAYQL